MKRLLFVTDTLSAGGIERQLSYLLLGLKARGYEPHVLCLYGEKAGRSSHFAPILEQAQIPVHLLNLQYTALDKLRTVAAITKTAWQLRPEIVHAFNYHANLFSRAARPFMPFSTRLIGAVRNDYTPHQLRLEALSWRFCEKIVVNSPHLQEQLLSVGIPQKRIALIPNGLDVERFTKVPEQIAERGSKTIVMMGRISRQKSPHLLLEALALLQLPEGLRVYLVGEVDSHPLHDVRDLVTEASTKLGEIVIQRPQSAEPEFYYHAADFTVLASLYEGLPNVMLESLAAGKPVLISAGANMAGVIEEGKTGWIVPTGDVQALAEKLKLVLALSAEEIQRMGKAARAKAAEFSIERMVEAHIQLYS